MSIERCATGSSREVTARDATGVHASTGRVRVEGVDQPALRVEEQHLPGVVVRGHEPILSVDPAEVLVPYEVGNGLVRPPSPPQLTTGRRQRGDGRGPVVGDVHGPVRSHHDVAGPDELAGALAVTTELRDEVAGGREHLDAEVAGVGDVHATFGPYRQGTAVQPELARTGPLATPLTH